MKFFKTFFAALLAVVVGMGLVCMLWVLTIVGIVAAFSMEGVKPVEENSVLRLDLGKVTDSPSESIFEVFDFQTMQPLSQVTLLDTIKAIEAAAEEAKIEGIYLNLDESAEVSTSSLEELRAALEKFKTSGKFVIAYQDYYSQVSYWFASVADKVYLNPAGDVEWKGLSMRTLFFKGLLEKLSVEPVIIRHGSFKAAVEPFMLDKMSDENRLQNLTLAQSVWRAMVSDVAVSRKLDPVDLQKLASELVINSPAMALEKGLVDDVIYEDQVRALMAEKVGEDDADDLNIVSFADWSAHMRSAKTPAKKLSKNKIAVVYADGEIVSGKGAQGQVGSAALVKKLAKVRDDDEVRAVVLRVNSPGGSALASDVMLREIKRLKEKVPVIVSMGSVAASGGYYISCAADAILAGRTTITGSIGVYGLYMNGGKALSGKLGVTVDGVNTNPHADMGSPFRSPSSAEMAFYQNSVEQTYSEFIGHVAKGRNMSTAAVDKIGQGRIWAGVDALDNGLVDAFGGIRQAIEMAAGRVGVADDYRVWEVKGEVSPFETLAEGFSARAMRNELGEAFAHYNNVVTILRSQGIQARMPWIIEME